MNFVLQSDKLAVVTGDTDTDADLLKLAGFVDKLVLERACQNVKGVSLRLNLGMTRLKKSSRVLPTHMAYMPK